MKKLLLSTLAIGFLTFATIGQKRFSGTPQQSFQNATYEPSTEVYEVAEQKNQSNKATPTSMVKALCIDTLLFEDFQSESIPGTWLNLDLDGLTDANANPSNWYTMADLQTTTPGDTNYVAASSSWFTPAGTANNVLILDAVEPCASTVMKWSSAPFEGPVFMDGYEVRISTTGTNIGDFSTVLFTAAESVGGTATPSAGTVHTNYNGTNGVLQEWILDLGAYDNQTVYIAFFHDSNDDNLIKIDNIFIGLSTPYDLSILSTSTEPYFMTPITQVTPRTFTSTLTLEEDQPVTNPAANFEIFQGATSVYTNNQSSASLSPGMTLNLTSTGYTPNLTAMYTAVITASATEVDPFPLNNIDSVLFSVSDSTFATENGITDGALSIGAGSEGVLGNEYSLVATDELTSMTFTLTAPTLGDTIVGVVYDVVGGVPNQVIAMTDTLFITSVAQAEYTLHIVGESIELVAGNYIVGIKESLNGAATLGTNTEFYTPSLAWVFFGGTWANNEDFGFPNTYLLRANFGLVCDESAASFSETTTDLTANFTDASTDTDSWFWDFGDGNTSTMQNPSHSYASAGDYTVCLISANSCSADTICTTVSVCITPTANYSSVVNGDSVTFTNSSTVGTGVTYSWDFGDGQTSTSENPTNTYSSNGNFNVCLIVSDDCSSDTLCTSVTLSSVGLEEGNLIDNLSLFPVPADGTLTIANLPSGENFKLELLNTIGQLVQVVESNGFEMIQFNVNDIVDGYYHLQVSGATIIGTKSVVIKH